MFITIKNLSIDFKEFNLNNISFTLQKGDYLCIIGPTGAGKTILLESILGLHKLSSGKIIINGKDITDLPLEKRNIGIIYQDFALFPHLTVLENIEYGINEKTEVTQAKINNLCNILKIAHLIHRYPDTLSGGEKQRVALARALIVEPELLLMDEPFASLDPQIKLEIRELIKTITTQFNITVIHITHDFDDVITLSNKLGIIKNGKLIQFGSKDEILLKPATDFIAEFVGTNILEGKIVDFQNGLSIVSIGKFLLKSIDKKSVGENVKLAVRPENIILFKKPPENLSARNIIEAKFSDKIILNNICYAILKVEKFKIKVLLTIPAFEEFNFKKGDKVFAIIKATNLRIL